MLLLMMSTLSWAYFEVDGINYNINEDGESVEVTSYYGSYSGDIVIPSTVTYDNKTYSVTSIGNDAFYWCTSLTSISIPEGVTSIGTHAFSGCSSLTSISIPEGVTSIGGYAFSGCSSLTSISIPEGVTSIGNLTFAYCSSLTSISIPESVTSIGDWAFGWCSALTSIICYSEKVPKLESDVFYDVPTSEATLYVPASALRRYKVTNQWKDFGTILSLEDIPAGISNIKADETNAPYYTLDGKRVDNPTQKGIYIRNGKKILIK